MCWGIVDFAKNEKQILICSNTTAAVLEKIGEKWSIRHRLRGHSAYEKAIGFDYNNYLWTFVVPQTNMCTVFIKISYDHYKCESAMNVLLELSR